MHREDFLEREWPKAIEALGAELGTARRLLLDARPRFAKNALFVEVPGAWGVSYLRKNRCEERLRKILGRTEPIHFLVAEIPSVSSVGPTPARPPAPGADVRPEETAPPAATRQVVAPVRPSEPPLFGRGRVGTPVPIAEARTLSRATIEGEIVESRIFDLRRQGRKLNLLLWDGTESIFAERLLPEDGKTPPIVEAPVGARIRASGKIARRAPDEPLAGEPILHLEEAVRVPCPARTDGAIGKRVELHLATKASRMDALIEPEALFDRMKAWGWDAVAITDRDATHALPRAHVAAQKRGIRLVHGAELAVVDDTAPLLNGIAPTDGAKIDFARGPWFVFDIETTGLSARYHEILEIAGERFEGERLATEFTSLVRPTGPVSQAILDLTKIPMKDLAEALPWGEVAERIAPLADGAVWVAHNAAFDAAFLRIAFARAGIDVRPLAVLDTLALSRALDPEHASHRLDRVAKRLGLSFAGHHRAANDARVTSRVFARLRHRAQEAGIWPPTGPRAEAFRARIAPALLPPFRATALAASPEGLERINEWLTLGFLEHHRRVPKVPLSRILEDRGRGRRAPRAGVLLGSHATEGEVVERILDGASREEAVEIARRYDFLEVAPASVYGPLVRGGRIPSVALVHDLRREVLAVGEAAGIPVVATSLPKHLDSREAPTRRLLSFADRDRDMDPPSAPLLTTPEMIAALTGELDLAPEEAERLAIFNPREILSRIASFPPYPDGFHPPRIEGAEETLRDDARVRARGLYGDRLPPQIESRLNEEVEAICRNGYASLYLIARDLVRASEAAGYSVGSRGSVGSSFAAFLLGITEVNPLAPHVACAPCGTLRFVDEAGCGADLPRAACENCGADYRRDGWRIPFEAFLGIGGKKVPDIDLNFSGLWQAEAMRTLETRFGPGRVYRAGTVLTLQEKTAFGFSRKFREAVSPGMSEAETRRLALAASGVARSTGQHPGGVVILPEGVPITRFMPAQRPPKDKTAVTTHFDFHAYEGTLLKVDCLGHDGPTALRLLGDMTGVDPLRVAVEAEDVLSLFRGTESIGVDPKRLGCPVGTLGIPEFGTELVRQILVATKPKTVEELIRISGLSHGTGVWQGNAEELIASGRAKLSEVIATREDIWNELVRRGIPNEEAFRIMEKVRKGKGLSPDEAKGLRAAKCPGWLVDSMARIEYLFPKAHAVAYCLTSLRIAWFKVRHPAAFYAQAFSLQVKDLDLETILAGERKIRESLVEIRNKIRARSATPAEEAKAPLLELALEMTLRGIRMLPPRLADSDAWRFRPSDEGLRASFRAVPGLGEVLAERILAEREQDPFRTIEDFENRTSASRPVVAALKRMGTFGELAEKAQLSLV